MRNLSIPVGVSDFAEIRRNGYYYIDKSGLISDLLVRKAAKVTLITRPRRFGKTLNMDMLRTFFEKTNEDTSVYFKAKTSGLAAKNTVAIRENIPLYFSASRI